MAYLNIALNKPASASGYVLPFKASNALNGTTNAVSRWLCNSVSTTNPAKLTVSLNGLYIITSWVVRNMGAAGWASPNYNMSDYKLQGSVDNATWVDIDSVASNTLPITTRPITSTTAYRYVRLYVSKGLNTNPQLASAVEFEVYGYTTPLLSSLVVSAGSSCLTFTTPFSPTTFGYTVSAPVPYATSSINISAIPQDSNATVKVNGTAVVYRANTPVALNVGSNNITVEVTGTDGQVKQTYTVAITRQQGAILTGLSISSGALDPTFTSDHLTYTAPGVGYDTTSVTVTPTTTIAGCTIAVNGSPATSGQPSTVNNLTVGSNTINIVVTNGGASQTYTIAVVRASSPYLQSVTGIPGITFVKSTYTYSTTTSASKIKPVVIIPEDTNATIALSFNGAAMAYSQSLTLNLNTGANTLIVAVTSASGGDSRTYTFTITK